MDKGVNLKQSVNSFAANGQPTYVGNSYLFQSGKSNSVGQGPVKNEGSSFAVPIAGSAARNVQGATGGVTYQSGSSVSAPIGFSTGAQGTANVGSTSVSGNYGVNSGSSYASGNYVVGSNYVSNYGGGYSYVPSNVVGGLSNPGVA
jgi:hypothetical protein